MARRLFIVGRSTLPALYAMPNDFGAGRVIFLTLGVPRSHRSLSRINRYCYSTRRYPVTVAEEEEQEEIDNMNSEEVSEDVSKNSIDSDGETYSKDVSHPVGEESLE